MLPPPRHRIAREARELARLAVPLAAAQAGQALMGLVDTAVVGRVGAGPLAAVGLSNTLFFACSVVGVGLMMGLDPLAAQAFGAGDRLRARHLLWQGAWLALLASAVLSVPIALSPQVLRLIGLDPWVAQETRRCLFLRLPGLLPMLLFVASRAYLQAAGRARPMLWATLIANAFNFSADLLLVFGGASLPAWTGPLRRIPALGAAGSALSTTLGTILQLAILALAVRFVGEGALSRGARRPVAADIARAARVGLPVGLQMGAEVGVFSLVGLLAGRLGTENLAANQVAITLASLTFTVAVGVGNAGSVRVGWAVGMRDAAAARLAGLVAFGSAAWFMGLSGLVFWLVPARLAGLLTDRPDVVRQTVPLLAVAAVFQLSDGVQAAGAGILRGAGDTRFPFLANVAGHYLVGLPIALALGFGLRRGITGLWWGLCAGLTAVAVALFLRFWRVSARPIVPLEVRPFPREAA